MKTAMPSGVFELGTKGGGARCYEHRPRLTTTEERSFDNG